MDSIIFHNSASEILCVLEALPEYFRSSGFHTYLVHAYTRSCNKLPKREIAEAVKNLSDFLWPSLCCRQRRHMLLSAEAFSMRLFFQVFFDILSRVGFWSSGNLLRCSAGDYRSSFVPSLGPHINNIVRCLNDIQIVLNHNYGISPF